MQIPELSLEEERFASYEIMRYYRYPEMKHEHGKLINHFFSDLILKVFDNTLILDEVLSSKTEEEQLIIKKLLQVTSQKLNEENESGYFGVEKSYDFDGDNWHYVFEIRGYFSHINFFSCETLRELEDEVLKNNCPWLIVDETLATKSRIMDATLRREKERAYDEEYYSEPLEIHPRYAVKIIQEYYESSSDHDGLIEDILSRDCLNAIYNNTLDIDSFLNSDNPMEKAIVRLLVPFINNKLHSDALLNDTGIFGVKTTYDENGNNWIYDDGLRSYFSYTDRIYAKTLSELKRKVKENKGIWFVLDGDMKKRSLERDRQIREEDNLFKNPSSELRAMAKGIIKESFLGSDESSYSELVGKIHTSSVMESIIGKTLDITGFLYSCEGMGRIIVRVSIQKMKDALSFARMNNYTTGYFGVIHPEYGNWSYVNLVEREYLGWDDYDLVYGSSLMELEQRVKSDEHNIWCIFDYEKAEKSHEIDLKIINSENPGSIKSIDDYWNTLRCSPSKKQITAEYIERLIEKNQKSESFLQMKEKERLRWKKIREFDEEYGWDMEQRSSYIESVLKHG